MAIIGEWIRRVGYLIRRGARADELRREMEAHRALVEPRPDQRGYPEKVTATGLSFSTDQKRHQ